MMMLDRQFEAPTFAQITRELKAFHALLYQFTLGFLEVSRKEPYLELAPINDEVATTVHTLSNMEAGLRKRIQFYDVQPDSETIMVQSLDSIMRLPPCVKKATVESQPIRKSSYVPRVKHRGPYRSYTAEEKNHVVHLNQMGMTFAAISKNLQIPQKNVVRWCKEGFIDKDSSRRVADADMELELAEWLRQARRNKLLRQSDIQEKARAMSKNPNFKASRGWLKNFLRRMGDKSDRYDQSE